MVNFMKKRRTLIIVILIVLIIFGSVHAIKQYKKTGDVSNVKLYLDNSNIFSEEDINSAINVIYEDFKNHYPATLESLTYDEKKCKYMEDYYKKEYNASEVIVFYTDFTTYSGYASKVNNFNENQRYSDWVWILTRDDSEEWVLREWGY